MRTEIRFFLKINAYDSEKNPIKKFNMRKNSLKKAD